MSGNVNNPLIVIVERITPRIRYVLDTCLRDVLGFEYQLQLPHEPRPERLLPYLNYTGQSIAQTLPMACNGLLFEDGIRQENITFGPTLPASENEPLFKTDHFAYIFYRLSEYAHYAHPQRDRHGRYRDALLEPSVEQGLAHLESKLAPLYDPFNPPRKERQFDYEITIDVDHPWKFRHKGKAAQWGGLLKDLFQGRWGLMRERLRFLFGGSAPYEAAAKTIHDICPPAKTTLFFLVDGDHRLDSRFSLRMEPYQNMVQQYKSAGFGIGLHPSYTTFKNQERLTTEKVLLESVAGPVSKSRQHYLRYQLPETFSYLWQAGIREEYTICPVGGSGAKTGILRPYFWFDLSKNEATTLRMHPAVVMDRNLQQYQDLSPQEALAEIKKWIAEVRKWKGKFVMVLHNETFSESGEWKGWLPVIESVIAELKSHES
jgi:hypothetical protein